MVRSLMGDYEEIQYQCQHWVNKNLYGKAQSAVHVTNEEVRNRIQNAIWVHDDVLTIVKKRKFSWYRHISRSSGMAKTILQRTVKGVRRRGRQKKRWEDNIKEWTGMEFGDSLIAAGDRERWKVIVATSSVAPRRPSGLRLRWERWNMSRGLKKTNKISMRPAKTQISLGNRPVWSESSLCAKWEAKDRSFLQADSEDSDQTGRMPRLIWVFAGRTAILLVLSCRGSYVSCDCMKIWKYVYKGSV